MNVLISALTVFSLYHFREESKKLDKKSWWLMLFGTLLPSLDYLQSAVFGLPGIVWTPLWFHSPFYLATGLLVIAIWVWVRIRSLSKAAQCFWPLAGQTLYLALTALSTERVPVLRPFYSGSYAADLVNQGYLFPALIILLLWVTKRWNGLKTRNICLTSLVIVPAFLVLNLGVRVVSFSQLPENLQGSEQVSATPANILQSKWNVVAFKEGKYHYQQLNLFSGWGTESHVLQASNDSDLTQALLEDPHLKGLYVFQFKNPVISTKLLNEQLRIEITELVPLKEVVWTKNMVVIKNSNEQIIDITWERGTLF